MKILCKKEIHNSFVAGYKTVVGAFLNIFVKFLRGKQLGFQILLLVVVRKGSQMKFQVSMQNKVDGWDMFTKIQIVRYKNSCSFRSTVIPSLLLLLQRLGFCTGGKVWFHGGDNTCHLSQKVNIASKKGSKITKNEKAKL